MRVDNLASSTTTAWRVGAWLNTIANRPCMGYELMTQYKNLIDVLTQLLSSLQFNSLTVMVLCLFFTPTPPLRSSWSSEIEAPRSRDRSGYCLAQDQGVAIHQCFHASNNQFGIFLRRPLSVSIAAVCSAPPAKFKMPRVRPRMSSRRGSSRGHVSRQPSSTTSDPSSEASDFGFDRYPMTRSGRGRGRGQFITEACSHHSQSHTACFRFPYSLGNSSFIASVTIELCEDTVGPGAIGPGTPLVLSKADKNESSQIEITQGKDQGGSATQETTIHAGPSAPAGGGSSSKEGQPSEFKDPDQFGCRIVEEPPPTSHED